MRRIGVLIIVLALAAGMVGCRPVQYQLTITSTEGGSVVSPGEGTFTYNKGRVVRVRARNCLGYWFSEWTGDVDTIANLRSFVTTITMDGDYTIEASFKRSCDRETSG
ncbi:MAG: InlB B-repeat-containing protein [Dehalococcoidia bacterium]